MLDFKYGFIMEFFKTIIIKYMLRKIKVWIVTITVLPARGFLSAAIV